MPEVSKPMGGIAGTWSQVGPPRLSWELLPPFPGPGAGMVGSSQRGG